MRNCVDCGKPSKQWELRCSDCAVPSGTDSELSVLLSAPSLRFGLVEFLKLALIAVGIVVSIMLLRRIVTPLFGDWFQLLAAVVTVIGVILAITFLYVGWDKFRSEVMYEVTNVKIQTTATIKLDKESPRLKDWTVSLRDVTSIRLEQGPLGRLLNYGDLIFCTEARPAGALRFNGIADPSAFKERAEKLVSDVAATPRQAAEISHTKVEPKPLPEPVKRAGFLQKLGCALLLLLAAYIAGYIVWYTWSLSHQTMTPGESRDVQFQGMGLVALPQPNGPTQFDWTPADTAAIRPEISSPQGVRVTVKSISVTVSKMGEGNLVGLEFVVNFYVLPDTPEGEFEVAILLRHPRLVPPYVSHEPLQRITIKVRK